jgi:hypothetical protein
LFVVEGPAHKKSPAEAGLFVSESAALRVVRMRQLNLETLLSLKSHSKPDSPVSRSSLAGGIVPMRVL